MLTLRLLAPTGIALYNYLKYQQYTKDPSGHGHGPPMTHGGFDDTTEDAYEEGRPMLNTSQRDRPDEVSSSLLTFRSFIQSDCCALSTRIK